MSWTAVHVRVLADVLISTDRSVRGCRIDHTSSCREAPYSNTVHLNSVRMDFMFASYHNDTNLAGLFNIVGALGSMGWVE